jgi:hypothetical protein
MFILGLSEAYDPELINLAEMKKQFPELAGVLVKTVDGMTLTVDASVFIRHTPKILGADALVSTWAEQADAAGLPMLALITLDVNVWDYMEERKGKTFDWLAGIMKWNENITVKDASVILTYKKFNGVVVRLNLANSMLIRTGKMAEPGWLNSLAKRTVQNVKSWLLEWKMIGTRVIVQTDASYIKESSSQGSAYDWVIKEDVGKLSPEFIPGNIVMDAPVFLNWKGYSFMTYKWLSPVSVNAYLGYGSGTGIPVIPPAEFDWKDFADFVAQEYLRRRGKI